MRMATPAVHACADTHQFNQRASFTRSDFFFFLHSIAKLQNVRRGERGKKTAPVFFFFVPESSLLSSLSLSPHASPPFFLSQLASVHPGITPPPPVSLVVC